MARTKRITLEHAESLIKSTRGAIFGVEFIKADGSRRAMTCRLGVRKGLTGKGQAFDPSEHDLLTVFSMGDNGYRNIRLNALRRVTVAGQAFAVVL